MPNLLSIFGLRFFFYSAEHEPVHVESGDGMAKFEIVDGIVSLKSNDGMKAARMGLSYQTLINTLVHRYLTGSVTFKEQF